MPKTFTGGIPLTNNFDVKITKPLDVRLVVDSYADLTNGTIEAPYQGMVVNIKGTSELWIFKAKTIEESYETNENGSPKNWELVTGSGGGDGLSKYSLPVMTPEMVEEASNDHTIDFDGSEDPYILIDDGLNPSEVERDTYGSLIYDMMGAIRSLQAEVARLRNSFDYGIDSYVDTRTAKSVQLGSMTVEDDEPLWAIDPGYLSLVPDSVVFNTGLDSHHQFETFGHGSVDVSVNDQLTFNGLTGIFHDGKKTESDTYEDLTLYKLTDSKLITYLVTNKPNIRMNLVSLDDKTKTRVVDFAPLLRGNVVNKYGFCVVISRKVKVDSQEKGFNYIYFSIINYENDRKLFEGYLTDNGTLTSRRVESELYDERYSIESLEFDDLTLSRMKFYTKFEDFSEEVISSAPSEDDYKYEVAHIAIRSVKNTEMLNTVKDHLRDNELIWNKASKTLHIKSDGNIYTIGSTKPDDNNNDNNMTDKQIIEALNKMGIIVNVQYDGNDNIIEGSLSNISLAPISDVTFVNEDTDKKFTFSVDAEGNLVGKDKSATTIAEYLSENSSKNYDVENYEAVRGFSSDYLYTKGGITKLTEGVNKKADAGKKSDRLRISSFYAPIITDETHGCTHSFIELENTSDVDIPLTGVYLHFFNPYENNNSGVVHHLALDGVIKAGGTYLVRGAKHAEFDDESAFIKVKTYDKEWYDNKQLVSFEQVPANLTKQNEQASGRAYRFCLTYGLENLEADTRLVKINPNNDVTSAGYVIGEDTYKKAEYPNIILNPRFIDSCSYSTDANVSKLQTNNPWYANGGGVGITIKANTMFRLTFALDPAMQAFNGFNAMDSTRTRYNKGSDLQIVDLSKEFIGYPFSKETVKIDRYTPKASFENKNVMTDKSQLNKEKPNMVTCSFGVDVYNTRCFNWISCGTFDEYVWLRVKNDSEPNEWIPFQSYTKVSSAVSEKNTVIHRKEYLPIVNNTVYARMINRFPGNDVLFTAHKCVVVLPDAETPTVYEYVVGRPDKDGNPDFEHTNEIYTFTVYPRTYEGRVYQVTDQQGFHWIEYQVWAAAAEYLNTKIASECKSINDEIDEAIEYNTTYAEDITNHTKEARPVHTKVFPILINTGDMTQSGARINEWLDYYNGGVSLFNHLEQMNCVGNNDLCPINPRELGTGDDSDKSSSHFFHYFYCFDVMDNNKYTTASEKNKKFFSGETLIVKAHSGKIDVVDDKYIPSLYYFKTNKVLYVVVNSEIPLSNVQSWFGISSGENDVNIYTGIEVVSNGNYAVKSETNPNGIDYFTPIYETLYTWLNTNDTDNDVNVKNVVVAMHEMPFTVITNASLKNAKADTIPCTRNYPTNYKRLGSNVNQLKDTEDRGIYWCSRLLEYFNCKLVIGGHKHTYALSYPIKEKYSWTYKNNGVTSEVKDSEDEIKPMFETLEGEAGADPTYNISWGISLADSSVRTEYNITSDTSLVNANKMLNSTKTPYVPKNLYDNYGKDNITSGLFRCCTPTTEYDEKYDGFVSYSMCQATGYKLKSNKELPSATQVFSKIIPKTTNPNPGGSGSDGPSPEQLYPMYSILEFSDDCKEVTVTMNRITGIFKSDGEDKFTQGDYGKTGMGRQVLCTVEKEDCKSSGLAANKPSDATVDDRYFATDENKIYKYTSDGWKPDNTRMYGIWLSENDYKTRLAEYLANPTSVSDNRYLHIKF